MIPIDDRKDHKFTVLVNLHSDKMKSVPFNYLIWSIVGIFCFAEKLMWLRAGIDSTELIKGTLQQGRL